MDCSMNKLALVSQRYTFPLLDPQAIMSLDLIAVFAAMVCIISPAENICQQIGKVQNP